MEHPPGLEIRAHVPSLAILHTKKPQERQRQLFATSLRVCRIPPRAHPKVLWGWQWQEPVAFRRPPGDYDGVMTAPDESTPAPPPPSRRDYGRIVRGSLAGLLIAIFLIFAIQNAEPVDLEFLWWNFETRRIVLLLGAAAFGVAVWELVGFLWRRRRRKQAAA